MRDEKKKVRHEAITQAAYLLLAEKGYEGASMLSIAKTAKASNETLYRWYGSKCGLFEAMVQDNSEATKTLLKKAVEDHHTPLKTLAEIAPVLLTMLLGERAILLNRAAAADHSGELGAAISAGGRNIIQPLIANVMNTINGSSDSNVQEMTDWFVSLLVGDLQIKRAIGVTPEPTQAQIKKRSHMALDAFSKLLRTL